MASNALKRSFGIKRFFPATSMSQVEAAARTVSKPSFPIFHLNIPMGSLMFSSGETPKEPWRNNL